MQKMMGVTSKHKVNTATKVKTNQDEHINQGEQNIRQTQTQVNTLIWVTAIHAEYQPW